jgi:hypothetical protein
MVAAIGAAVGGGVSYVAYANPVGAWKPFGGGGPFSAYPLPPSSVAGMAAFFSFISALGMAGVMTSIIKAAVHTVFVCFAANPGALGATHPAHLAALSAAWAKFHPVVWASSGYARAFPAAAAAGPGSAVA